MDYIFISIDYKIIVDYLKMSKDQTIERSQNTSSNLMNNAFENVEKPLADPSTATTQSRSNILKVACEQILKKYNMSGKNRISFFVIAPVGQNNYFLTCTI